MRRGEQILAAHHVGHALCRIVERHRQMIGGGRVLAREHDIAMRGGVGAEMTMVAVVEVERRVADPRQRRRHVEPPAMRLRKVGRGEAPAGAGIDRPVRAMGGGDAGGDIGAGAETGIEQAVGAQPIQRGVVSRQPVRLEHDLAVPGQPQPVQVAQDRIDMFGPAARAVDILDPQQEASAARAREIMRTDRGKGVACVQPPGRAGGEAGDDHAPMSGRCRAAQGRNPGVTMLSA